MDEIHQSSVLGQMVRPGSQSQPAGQMLQQDPGLLVLGSEGAGLDQETLAACDRVVEIPMADGVPSLNVATASAVLLWERRRTQA